MESRSSCSGTDGPLSSNCFHSMFSGLGCGRTVAVHRRGSIGSGIMSSFPDDVEAYYAELAERRSWSPRRPAAIRPPSS